MTKAAKKKPGRESDAAARALRLLGDRRLAAAQLSGRRAVNSQSRSLGHRQADGAAVLAPPTGVTQLPDVPNWSWHEYGMRVGVWRFFDLYKRLKIRPTLAINARVCEDYARVAQEAKNDGWEFMGHSYSKARSTTNLIRRR